MRGNTIICIVLLGVLGNSCIESFDLKNIRHDNALVVEGHISNIEKPQQIMLSRTSPLNEKVFIPESGASVSVENDSGEKVQFNEVKPGIYESQSFAGVVGMGYTLSITTSNGHTYISRKEILKAVPPIGKIYAEFVTSPQRGIQISVDTEDPNNQTHYYRWSYVETYEIHTPYPSNYVVLPGDSVASWRYDRVDQCWANDTLREVLVKSTRGQTQDKVVAFTLRFIPEDSYIFRVKYSMLVQQFSMSEETYNYWENIRIFNETQGTLSDVQPGTIASNVVGVTDPSETVLGYFEASGISEQRVFFDYRDFKDDGYERPTYKSSCYELEPIFVKEADIAEYMKTRSEDLAIWDVIGVSPVADFELFPKSCCDCSDMGSTVKPSFWK